MKNIIIVAIMAILSSFVAVPAFASYVGTSAPTVMDTSTDQTITGAKTYDKTGTANASTTIGASGTATPITQIVIYTQTIPGSNFTVNGNTAIEHNETVTGFSTSDTVWLVPGNTQGTGTGICGCRASATNTFAGVWGNATAATHTVVAGSARLFGIRQ